MNWSLRRGRPCVQVILTLASGGAPIPRMLLADAGAESRASGFDLILDEDDCLLCGGITGHSVNLSGAFAGSFPLYEIPVSISALNFDQPLRVVGVPAVPAGFDGIACFSFLSRFTYGNFGDAGQFGLES